MNKPRQKTTTDVGQEPRKRGRPRSMIDKPQRTLGRVAEEQWNYLQHAARVEGETFTRFALRTLLTEARRVLRRKRD